MPHFGLMDERAMGPVEGPLLRSRLHIRGARQRFREGAMSLGLITLYDALISAMEWYFALPERRKTLAIRKYDDVRDDRVMYRILTESAVLDGRFDYGAFDALVTEALQHEMPSLEHGRILSDVESVMTQLGVMPFDEKDLPVK